MAEVPFFDLTRQSRELADEAGRAFAEIAAEAAFVCGRRVRAFEEAFAASCGVPHCVAVSNGTVALQATLMALGIGPGDEVLVPSTTFIATAEAVTLVGAKPVLVDCLPDTMCMDVADAARRVTPRTKAVIPVHLYGRMADVPAALELAEAHGLKVVEDACQAHGARLDGRAPGATTEAAAYSFYPGKNLGAWGEGGAVATRSDALAEKLRLLRDHGSPRKYVHRVPGSNFRLDEIQGAVLGLKLPRLAGWNERRRQIAERYVAEISANADIQLPPLPRDSGSHVWHLFVVRVASRDRFMEHMASSGVRCAIHYPHALHLTEAYAHLGYRPGDLPQAEAAADEVVSLPLFPEMTDEEVGQVIAAALAYRAS